MWTRLKRAVRSFVGFFVSQVEDPELILQQNIRDLNDQVPRMNENIAMVRANLALLEKESAKLSLEIEGLSSKIKAAINANRDDLAGGYALQLQQAQARLARNDAEVQTARAAFEKSMQLKKVFFREKELKTREAMQAIREHRRGQWQAKVADAMESFQLAGIDSTHDEMIRKIEERTAINEARMQMALEAVDGGTVQIEEEAQRLQANELVQRLKLEMGIVDALPAEPIRLSAQLLDRKG